MKLKKPNDAGGTNNKSVISFNSKTNQNALKAKSNEVSIKGGNQIKENKIKTQDKLKDLDDHNTSSQDAKQNKTKKAGD